MEINPTIAPRGSASCTTKTLKPLGRAVSPSRHIFQRLTNELSRNFPRPFGHTPVVFHHARFHQKPPKTRTAPTHARHASYKRPPKLFSPIVTLQINESPRPIQSPDCQGGVTYRLPSRDPAAAHNFDVSTFRFFDVSAKNHPKPEPPQHMPATRVANEKIRVCHYMSPWVYALFCTKSQIRAEDDRRELD
ncbi:hypothetical protein B7486_13330 [cyanobacterium TDX16]|nr:hypothetical protein B7486_13330 [cyanobacterium TDX16]